MLHKNLLLGNPSALYIDMTSLFLSRSGGKPSGNSGLLLKEKLNEIKLFKCFVLNLKYKIKSFVIIN